MSSAAAPPDSNDLWAFLAPADLSPEDKAEVVSRLVRAKVSPRMITRDPDLLLQPDVLIHDLGLHEAGYRLAVADCYAAATGLRAPNILARPSGSSTSCASGGYRVSSQPRQMSAGWGVGGGESHSPPGRPRSPPGLQRSPRRTNSLAPGARAAPSARPGPPGRPAVLLARPREARRPTSPHRGHPSKVREREPYAAHCTAAGPGLFGAVARSVGEVVVVARDVDNRRVAAGGAAFRASMAGPSKPHVGMLDNGDGTYAVTYRCPVSGVYTLRVTVTTRPPSGEPAYEEHVLGSPFKIRIYDRKSRALRYEVAAEAPPAQRWAPSGGANVGGEDGALDDEGWWSWKAGGRGSPAGRGGGPRPYGTMGAPRQMTAGEVIELRIRAKAAGDDAWPGERFEVSLSSLPGFDMDADADAGAEGDVESRSASADGAALEGGASSIAEGGDVEPRVRLRNSGDGAYVAEVTVFRAGVWALNVALEGVHVHNSPVPLRVRPGSVHAPATHIAGSGLAVATAGAAATARLRARDEWGNAVGQGGAEVRLLMAPLPDGDAVGDSVSVAAFAASASPAARAPREGGESASVSDGWRCQGNALPEDAAAARAANDTSLAALGASAGDTPDPRVAYDVRDHGDGSYTLVWRAARAGGYVSRILLNGNDACSPFHVRVNSGPTDAQRSVVTGLGARAAPAGVVATFAVEARDACGNGRRVGGDRWFFRLVPKPDEKGDGDLATWETTVPPDHRVGCPESSVASAALVGAGPGPKAGHREGEGPRGAWADAFAGGGTVADTAPGCGAREAVAAEGEMADTHTGQYDGSYICSRAGTYALEVRLGGFGGPLAGGSPARVEVLPDVTDARSCQLVGDGVRGARAGEAGLITVVARDREGNAQASLDAWQAAGAAHPTAGAGGGNDRFELSLRLVEEADADADLSIRSNPRAHAQALPGAGPARAALVRTGAVAAAECSSRDLGDGRHVLTYRCVVAGRYEAAVTLRGVHVRLSPFNLTVHPGRAHAPACALVGGPAAGAAWGGDAGLQGRSGDRLAVRVQARDRFGNRHISGGEALRFHARLRPLRVPGHTSDDLPTMEHLGAALGLEPPVARAADEALAALAAAALARTVGDAQDAEGGGAAGVARAPSAEGELGECEDFGDGSYSLAFLPRRAGPHALEIGLRPPAGEAGEAQGAEGSPLDWSAAAGAAAATADGTATAAGPALDAVHGSPWVVAIDSGDVSPAHCVVAGDGLVTAAVGVESAFAVVPCDAGGNACTVDLKRDQPLVRVLTAAPRPAEAPAGLVDDAQATVEAAQATRSAPGRYVVRYTPTRAGPLQVAVAVAGSPLPGSPWEVAVAPGPPSAFGSSVRPAPGATVPAAGGRALLLVRLGDAFGNACARDSAGDADVDARAEGPGEAVCDVAYAGGARGKGDGAGGSGVEGVLAGTPGESFVQDGTWSVSVSARRAGAYSVVVSVRGEELREGPARVVFTPGPTHAATCTILEDLSGARGRVDEWVHLTLLARDRFGNQRWEGGDSVEGEVLPTPSQALAVRDNGDGSYALRFVPASVGEAVVRLSVNGAAVGPSPHLVPVGAGAADPRQCTAFGKGLVGLMVNEVGTFVVQARDALGNALWAGGDAVDVLIGGSGARVLDLQDEGNGAYHCALIAFAPGDTEVHVRLNGGHVKGSPFAVRVHGYELHPGDRLPGGNEAQDGGRQLPESGYGSSAAGAQGQAYGLAGADVAVGPAVASGQDEWLRVSPCQTPTGQGRACARQSHGQPLQPPISSPPLPTGHVRPLRRD